MGRTYACHWRRGASRSKKLTVFTHTWSTWSRNHGSRARAHGDGATIALEHEAVGGDRVGKRVMTRGDVKGAGNVM